MEAHGSDIFLQGRKELLTLDDFLGQRAEKKAIMTGKFIKKSDRVSAKASEDESESDQQSAVGSGSDESSCDEAGDGGKSSAEDSPAEQEEELEQPKKNKADGRAAAAASSGAAAEMRNTSPARGTRMLDGASGQRSVANSSIDGDVAKEDELDDSLLEGWHLNSCSNGCFGFPYPCIRARNQTGRVSVLFPSGG